MRDKIPLNINQNIQMMIDHDPILNSLSKICAESSIIFYRQHNYPDFLNSPRFHDTSAMTITHVRN